jgi:hypothetical protein
MWLKPGGRAMRFTATQFLAVERVAFAWQARFPLLGPLALSVVDKYADGDGKLEVRLLGLPLQRQRDPETVAGEALGYLAELPFVPPAIAHNPELEWRELDAQTVEVASRIGGERLAVTLVFDADGRHRADLLADAAPEGRQGVDRDAVGRPVRRLPDAERPPPADLRRGVLGVAGRPLRVLARERDRSGAARRAVRARLLRRVGALSSEGSRPARRDAA